MNEHADPQLNLDPTGADKTADIRFHPTLLIGVGGTGAEVLRRVKRLYQDRSSVGARLHRFVFIDTDNRTFLDRDGLAPVDPLTERCLIGVHQAEIYLKNKAQHPWITARFPTDRLSDTFVRNLARGEGAGQLRSVGALALILDYQHVHQQISQAYTSLTSLAQASAAKEAADGRAAIDSRVVVYLVGSLAGGTGSGCFLDTALIARDICGKPHLVGMFALPESFEQQVRRVDVEQVLAVKANTYAALKELQHVLDASDARTSAIQFDYGRSRAHVLEASDRLFQLCYLVSNRNQRGGLSRPDELFELMARTIYQDTGSPFGTSKRVFDVNCGVLSAVSTCPKTRRPRLFSTVATASLVFPALRVAFYCTHRTLEEVIHDRLLGAAVPQKQIEDTVTGFLTGQHLDDRGRSNQILDDLLAGSDGARLSSHDFGLARTHGQRLGGREFVADVRAKWQQFLDGPDGLPRVERVVAENADRRLGQGRQAADAPIGPAVESFVLDVASAHGIQTARDAVDELQQVAQQMRREIEAEISEWNAREREAYQQDFDRHCREMTEMGRLRQLFSSKDDELKRRIVTLFNDFVDSALLQVARGRAINVINALESAAAEQQKRWDALAARLLTLKGRLASAARAHQTHQHGAVRGFIVERDATPSGYESAYFEEHRLPVDDAFALIAGAAGSRREIFARLVSANEPRTLHDLLSPPVARHYREPLVTKNLVDYVGDSLEERLQEVLEMCQPFWSAELPAVDVQFPEYVGVSTTPVVDQEMSVPPPRVGAWASATGYAYVVGHTPYEVVLSRRTYGARAAYLRTVPDWKAAYSRKRQDGQGHYMLQTHVAFEDLGDLE